MENNLFRKQSLDYISTPNDLHNYIRVTSPRLWMLLTVILALLIGLISMASSTIIENTIPITVTAKTYKSSNDSEMDNLDSDSQTWVTARLPFSEWDKFEAGMELRIGKEKGRLSVINADMDTNEVYLIFKMEHPSIPLQDGEYDAVLVLESTKAIHYLFK